MDNLSKKKCVPCVRGARALKGKELEPFYLQLGKGWEIVEEHHLFKSFAFKNFQKALAFAQIIGKVADEENHHPELTVAWGALKVRIWTHKIDGLTESDFILAAKIEAEATAHLG